LGIFRDLKPENFMFYKAPDGKVFLKVCDFGLAEILAGDQTLTEPCGTPNYMAPEMWRKEPYTNKVESI
jgi:serine/threonine protein kinase